MLLVLYYFGCKQQGRVSREEFAGGMMRARCSSEAGLKAKLPAIASEIEGPAEFKKYWEWLYTYHCDVLHGVPQKTASLDTVMAITPLVLAQRGGRFPWLGLWMAFLEGMKGGKRSVTKDAWRMMLELGAKVKPDLSNYEDGGFAWPTLMDDFVEKVRAGGLGGGSGSGSGGGGGGGGGSMD